MLQGRSAPWDNGRMSERNRRSVGVLSNRHTRASERRKKMVANRAESFAAAESWDLDFWQSCTPGERLSALVHLRRDVEMARAARIAGANKQQ